MPKSAELTIIAGRISSWATQNPRLLSVVLAMVAALAVAFGHPQVAYMSPLGGGGSGG